MLDYTTADEWRQAAMLRESAISEVVQQERRAQAAQHYAAADAAPDADTLADHELYILGKMEMAEYEQYLLFKHSPKG